jgi:hypothetical protein
VNELFYTVLALNFRSLGAPNWAFCGVVRFPAQGWIRALAAVAGPGPAAPEFAHENGRPGVSYLTNWLTTNWAPFFSVTATGSPVRYQ